VTADIAPAAQGLPMAHPLLLLWAGIVVAIEPLAM